LTGRNEHPDHDVIAAFRKRFLPQLRSLFIEVLKLVSRKMGLHNLGSVALDGMKVNTNASRHGVLSYEHSKTIEKHLRREVEGSETYVGHCARAKIEPLVVTGRCRLPFRTTRMQNRQPYDSVRYVSNDPAADIRDRVRTRVGNHSFRATGITQCLKNGGWREIAQQWLPTSRRGRLPYLIVETMK
jgi:hypothetical protein